MGAPPGYAAPQGYGAPPGYAAPQGYGGYNPPAKRGRGGVFLIGLLVTRGRPNSKRDSEPGRLIVNDPP